MTNTHMVILRALGGANRVKLMTGARIMTVDRDDALSEAVYFKIPRVGVVMVAYEEGSDTFRVTRTHNGGKKSEVDDVYIDNLKEVFENITGLYLTLI